MNMTITNISNQYLKVVSDSIIDFLAHPTDYKEVIITGSYNCDETKQVAKSVTAFADNVWKFNFNSQVTGEDIVKKILVRQNTTGLELNVLNTPIDLGYVVDNCTAYPCTLQTYATYFSGLFKTYIDAGFAALGIPCTTIVTVVGNEVFIKGIPIGYNLKEAQFASSSSPAPALFGDASSSTDGFFLGADGIYVLPALFNQTVLQDGIYAVAVKLVKESGYILESNCIFVDLTTACRVAAYLGELVKEIKTTGEGVGTTVHMLHYGLVNGSNCGCNCAEMCTIFIELDKILKQFESSLDTDCGC